MAINLRILFTGLCGFVPKQEIESHRRQNKMAVIMPFAAHHRTAVVIHKDFIETSSRPPLAVGDLRLFFLDGEEVSIYPPGGPDDVSIDWRDGELNPCPAQGDVYDFRYVARLEKVKMEAGRMRDLFAIGNGGSAVAGRVILEAGLIQTESVGTFRESVIKWKMEPKASSDPRYDQALAEAVQVIRNVSSGPISLLSRMLGKKDKSELVKLKPIGDKVEVFFKNLPPDQLANPGGGDILRRPDNHFFHYYYLSGSSHARIPTPFSCKDSEALESVDNPKCPPAQFVANAEI